jgi:hypothetical protein
VWRQFVIKDTLPSVLHDLKIQSPMISLAFGSLLCKDLRNFPNVKKIRPLFFYTLFSELFFKEVSRGGRKKKKNKYLFYNFSNG